MEYLRELAHIVTKSRIQKINLLRLSTGKSKDNDPYSAFYNSLQSQKSTSEADIAKSLGWDERSSHYRVFKSRLLERLLNSLLFLDPGSKDKNPYRVAYYDCIRNQFCVQVLLLFSARNAAIHIAKKTLKIAVEYEFTEICVYCTKALRSHAALTGELKAFEEYHKAFIYHSKVLVAEDKAKEEYERISIHYANSTSIKPQFAPQAIKSARAVKRLRLKYNTYTLYIYYYRLQGLAHYISQDYKSALLVWNRLLNYLQKKKNFESVMRMAEASLNKMACYLHLRNFKEGSKCAVQCKKLMSAGTNNWFYFMEYYFLLSMHSRQYKTAAEILLEAVGHARYQFLSDIRKEKWRVFTAYVSLANQMFKPDSQLPVPFRISKFMNETPLYSKDKCGYNIAILIIQFIYALKNQDYLKLIDKTAALRKYNDKHLKKDTTYRARIFIKMLISVVEKDFDLGKIRIVGQKYLSLLTDSPMIYSGNMDGMEVLSFENLWEEVLKILETNSK